MKKILQWMFLLTLIGAIGTTQAQTFNYACDFETDTTGWVLENGSFENHWVIDTAVNNTTSGSHSLYITNSATAPYANSYSISTSVFVAAYREVTLSAGVYDISYDWQCSGESTYDFLRVALLPSSASLTASSGYSAPTNFSAYNLPTGWIALDGSSRLNGNGSWQSYVGEVSIATAGTYKLAFIWRCDGSGGTNPPAAVDNVVFREQTCPTPSNLDFTNITESGATVSWTEVGTASAWQIEYGPTGFSRGSGTMVTDIYENPYTLTGLTANTAYDVYVQSVCDAGDESNPVKGMLRTACGVMVLPSYDNFESYADYEFPACWFRRGSESEVYQPYGESKALQVKSNETVLTPKYPVAANESAIYFRAKPNSVYSSGLLEVGYVTDTALWDYVAVKTIAPMNSEYHYCEIALDDIDVTDECYFVFTQKNATSDYSGWYIDDVTMFQLGECRSPKNFIFSDVTATSATVTWTCFTADANFQLSVAGGDTNFVVDITDGSTTYTLTDLDPETAYTVMARTMCSTTDSTMWIETSGFYTSPLCAMLEDASISSVGTTSAVINWVYSNEGNPNNGVVIRYMNPNDDTNPDGTVVSATGNSYFLTGLDIETAYDVEIATVCGNDTSSVYDLSFMTKSGVCGEIAGDGNTTTSYVPTYGYYRYSYTQSVYSNETLNGMDTIRGIMYKTKNNPMQRVMKIYLGNSSINAFASSADAIPHTQLTEVFSGTVQFSGNGWDTIMFNTPYAVEEGNVIVATMDNTGSYNSSYSSFYTHDGTALYKYKDSDPYNTTDLSGMSFVRYAPDVRFVGECNPITCAAPLVACKSVDVTSIDLTWMPGLDETSWCVDYRMVGEEDWTSLSASTTDTTISATGLIASTAYEFRVGSLCTSDTMYGYVTTYTACANIDIPYTNDFSAEIMNPCWVKGNLNLGSSLRPEMVGGILHFSKYNYVIFPQINSPLNTLQLSLTMTDVDGNGELYIGAVSELNGISSFVPIDTLTVDPLTPDALLFSILNSYEGDYEYLALMVGSEAVEIDNLTIDLIPTCPQPMHVHVSSLGGSQMTVAWNANVTATSWNVVIVPTGSDISTGEVLTTNEPMINLTGLTPSTTYDVYVSAVCTDGSSVNTVLTVTTMYTDPMVLPYSNNFSDPTTYGQWAFYSPVESENVWTIGSVTSNNNSGALYVSSDNGASNDYAASISMSVAYVPINIPENGQYALSYDWKAAGESSFDFGRVALIKSPYDFSTMSTSRYDYESSLPAKWIAVDGGSRLNLSPNWNTVMNKQSLTPGTYYLTMFWANDGSVCNNPAMAVDNISVMRLTCAEPTGIVVSEITGNSATISWNSDEMATNGWELSLNNGDPVTTTDTFYTFTDLMAGMGYVVTITTICSDEDESLSIPVTFYTECADITELPYVVNFDAEATATTDAHPHCWTVPTNGYPSVSTEYSETPALHFYCYQTSWGTSYLENTASMPRVGDGLNVSGLELQFSAKANYFSSNNILYVGVCKTAGDMTTYTAIDTIVGFTSDWSDYVVTFENYTDTGRYITFHSISAGSYTTNRVMVDDIMLQAASPCKRPVSVYIDSYTHNSANVHWIDTNVSATYKLAYSTGNDVTAAETVITDIDSTHYTITGLNGSTTYKVWVAADCALLSATSGWVSAGSFTTHPDCAPVTNLQVIDIDETRATLTWRAPVFGEQVTDYIVTYSSDMTNPVSDTVNVPYYFLTNLTTDAHYSVSVTTVCDTMISSGNTASFVPTAPAGCNTMGEGTSTISNCPVAGIWNYGMSQMIYYAEEMRGMGDTINGITFNCSYGSSARNITIYMAETNASNFNSGYLPTASMTQVYSGMWSVSAGLLPITFNTPFVRTDHTKNIVLCVDDNTGSYSGGREFYATEMEEYACIHAVSDGVNITDTYDGIKDHLRPNVVFDATCEPITCFPPSIVFTNVTDTQIDIAWRAGNDETSWRVEYAMNNEETWTVLTDNTTATSASLTNLTPGQLYRVRVGSNCSNEVAYRMISTYTECGPMPIPFYEDFTDSESGVFEKMCWTTGGNTEPQVSNVIGNGHILRLYDDSYVVLPKMRGNLNDLQVHFRYLTSQDTIWSLIGYMENPNEIGSFHVIDTLYDHNMRTGWYYTERLNNLPADAEGYLAFYTPHDLNYTFVDEILVEPVDNCYEPTNVVVSNITTTTADVTWNGSSSSYMVEYGFSGFAHGTGSSVVVNSTSAQITNMIPGTMYDVYVHAICGAGDTSHASNVAYMTTECAPVTALPYVMNFEEAYLPPSFETEMLPLCWNAQMDDTASAIEDCPQIVYDRYDDFAVNGDYALKMYNYSYVAMPELSAEVNTLCVRFSHYVESATSRLVVGVMDNVGAGCEATFQAIDTIVPANIDNPERYVVFFDQYTGTGKYITFRNIDANGTTGVSEQYLDSIVVDVIPSCPEVSNLEVVAMSSSTITIDWNDHGDSIAAWEIQYGTDGFELGTGTSVVVTSHPATISNLEILHTYNFWVRPICSSTDTGFYGYRPLVGNTSLCDAPIYSSTSPNGTTGATGDYPMKPYYNYSYSQTIIDAAYLSGQTDIAAFVFNDSKPSDGKMDNCKVWMGLTDKESFTSSSDWVSVSDMSLVFEGDFVYEAGFVTIALDSAFAYDGTSNLIIAIDRNDGSWQSGHNFQYVSDTTYKTLWQGSDYSDQDPTNPTYDGTMEQAHAAFQFITCGNSCPVPILTNVTDLTHESATIHWATVADANFEVAIRAQEEANMSAPVAVTGDSYTFNNLTPNVTYAYYVRQVCEEGVFSEWAEGNFTTADLPCYTPTDVTIVSKTAETVTVSWTAAEGQTKWTIHVFNTIEEFMDTVMSIPGTVTGLTGGMTYKVAVNAICATNYESEWSDTIEFTTTDCLPVNNVTVSGITESGAKVSWTAGGSEASWEINYGESGFGQGQGEFAEVNTNSYNITGLESDTEYDVYVRAMCSETFMSIWSDVVSFTTLSGDTPEGIDGVDGKFQFAIYPNPASGSTTITLNGIEGKVNISVVDMNGRTVTSENIECGSDCEKRIDVAGLAQGTYFVRVLGDDINSVRKLIVR